jgi:thioredoxin-like negative regulator of GroEL
VYPDPRVSEFIAGHFETARIHIKEQPAMWHRFGIRWTPTVMVLSPEGKEVYRVEGFLPADELLGQLELALGYLNVNQKKWKDAEEHFEAVVRDHPETDAAPEAMFWAGVARYSAGHDPKFLGETARLFTERYQDTAWAKRSVVWR